MLNQEYDELERLLKANASREATSLLVRIGKTFDDPRPEVVAPLLQHPSASLRAEALFVLCCCWRQAEFRPVAEGIWRDPAVDEEDRGRALMAWASFGWKTGDPETLRVLAQVLGDRAQPPMLRLSAEGEIYAVSGRGPNPGGAAEQDLDDVDGSVNWSRARAALAGAGVEVPREWPGG